MSNLQKMSSSRITLGGNAASFLNPEEIIQMGNGKITQSGIRLVQACHGYNIY